MTLIPHIPVREIYTSFNSPINEIDCGEKCAPHNPSGKPFCCDICEAVPAVYRQEWVYLQEHTNLWTRWRGPECGSGPEEITALHADTPENMILLACLGPKQCQREYRALSCRQFPFFPYISDDFRFLGLACEWEFEGKCWVIENIDKVSLAYREEFIQIFDELFSRWPQEMESYALKSEEMRSVFAKRRRRISILHRNGGSYLLSPGSERLARK
ncbi:MAG: hypothetical protein H8E28_01140 [Anaerolineae bacterium]|nr:hypothetical protein [Anaerolineae bacterium]MBL6965447.1 hypothetical protein [Anaerolineales bacterium]